MQHIIKKTYSSSCRTVSSPIIAKINISPFVKEHLCKGIISIRMDIITTSQHIITLQ